MLLNLHQMYRVIASFTTGSLHNQCMTSAPLYALPARTFPAQCA